MRQIRPAFFLGLVLFVSTFPNLEAYPICVIGGGISGLTVATRLQQRGYDVELFEANRRIGGKLNTHRHNFSVLEKGPIIFTKGEPYINAWSEFFKLDIVEYHVTDHAVMLPRNGRVIPLPNPAPAPILNRVSVLAVKYKEEYNKYPNSTWDDFGYSTVDFARYPELARPIESWLQERDLWELTPYFMYFITILGYGDLRLTPALYALKLVTAENADFFFEIGSPALTLKEGFDQLAIRIASILNKKYLGWEAIRIEKCPDGTQVVTFKQIKTNFLETRTCIRTILAFPPLYEKTKNMIIPMTTQESNILKAVEVKKYVASGLNIPSKKLTHTVYIILQPKLYNAKKTLVPQFEFPPGDGSLLALTRQSKDDADTHFTGYSWIYGDYDMKAGRSDKQLMREKMDDLLQQVDPSYKLYFLQATEYFPHVPRTAIMQDFYKGFDGIQGSGGIYWATTLLTMETVNNAIEMAEKLVARYF